MIDHLLPPIRGKHISSLARNNSKNSMFVTKSSSRQAVKHVNDQMLEFSMNDMCESYFNDRLHDC